MKIYLYNYLGISTSDEFEYGETLYALKYGPSSAAKHLKGSTHDLQSNGQPKIAFTTTSVHEQLITGSQSFLPELFRAKLLRFIAVLHMPFSIVERDEFRDLMLYSSPYLRHDDTLLKSGTSISTSLVTSFLACQVILISMLRSCGTAVHLSFDLWTSPNKYAFLGIVCHLIDRQWKARTVLLGVKPLYVRMLELILHSL